METKKIKPKSERGNKKMRKNKIVALALAVMTLMSMGTMAFADTIALEDVKEGNSRIELTAEGVQFKATLPMILPFHVDQTGKVTVAEDLYIHNQSAAPIDVIGAVVNLGDTGWVLHDYDLSEVDHYANLKTNTAAYGFKLNGAKADPETGVIDTTGAGRAEDATNEEAFAIIGSLGFNAEADLETNQNILPLVYNGKFAPQANALDAKAIGTVEFTLDFDTDGVIGVEPVVEP